VLEDVDVSAFLDFFAFLAFFLAGLASLLAEVSEEVEVDGFVSSAALALKATSTNAASAAAIMRIILKLLVFYPRPTLE
jgi:hypothetical protein